MLLTIKEPHKSPHRLGVLWGAITSGSSDLSQADNKNITPIDIDIIFLIPSFRSRHFNIYI